MAASASLNCRLCGQQHKPVQLQPGERAECVRCDGLMSISPRFGRNVPLGFAVAGLILFIPAALLPFVGASELGDRRVSLLLTGVGALWDDRMRALATLVLLCGALLPFTLLVALITLYGPEGLGRRWISETALARFAKILSRWAFPEVQVLAVLVGVIKLGSLVHLDLGPGFWCYCGMAASLLAAVHSFKYTWPDPPDTGPTGLKDWVAEASKAFVLRPRSAPETTETFRSTSQRSGRSRISQLAQDPGARFFGTPSRSACAAFAVAAIVLLAPANMLPVLTTATSGNNRTDTIYSGAMALGQQGLWSLAAIVFTASILIPALKLVGLTYLLYNSPDRHPEQARKMTRLYSLLAFIGRWSMLDVFLGAFLVGLVRFGEFATVDARAGLVAFAAVVILTVLATESFDPREIWLPSSSHSSS